MVHSTAFFYADVIRTYVSANRLSVICTYEVQIPSNVT